MTPVHIVCQPSPGVRGVGHGHDEAMEAGDWEFSLHGRVVRGVGHLGPLP